MKISENFTSTIFQKSLPFLRYLILKFGYLIFQECLIWGVEPEAL